MRIDTWRGAQTSGKKGVGEIRNVQIKTDRSTSAVASTAKVVRHGGDACHSIRKCWLARRRRTTFSRKTFADSHYFCRWARRETCKSRAAKAIKTAPIWSWHMETIAQCKAWCKITTCTAGKDRKANNNARINMTFRWIRQHLPACNHNKCNCEGFGENVDDKVKRAVGERYWTMSAAPDGRASSSAQGTQSNDIMSCPQEHQEENKTEKSRQEQKHRHGNRKSSKIWTGRH